MASTRYLRNYHSSFFFSCTQTSLGFLTKVGSHTLDGTGQQSCSIFLVQDFSSFFSHFSTVMFSHDFSGTGMHFCFFLIPQFFLGTFLETSLQISAPGVHTCFFTAVFFSTFSTSLVIDLFHFLGSAFLV